MNKNTSIWISNGNLNLMNSVFNAIIRLTVTMEYQCWTYITPQRWPFCCKWYSYLL